MDNFPDYKNGISHAIANVISEKTMDELQSVKQNELKTEIKKKINLYLQEDLITDVEIGSMKFGNIENQ